MRFSLRLLRAARLQDSFLLPNGSRIPAIGLGTWQARAGEAEVAVFTALEAGYRHIDTAWSYGAAPGDVEREVGRAIKESGVPRDDLFLTSKLWCSFHGSHVRQGVEESLRNLDVSSLDLFLIHWPVAFQHTVQKTPIDAEGNVLVDRKLTSDLMRTWRQLETLVNQKLVKAIGVSNYNITRLEALLADAHVRPACNQVELHIANAQPDLLAWSRKNDILLEAYSPLGSAGAPSLTHPLIVELATKYGCEPANIAISWQVARGVVVLPKSVTPERIRSNLLLIALEEEDVARLEAAVLDTPQRRVVDKSADWGVDDIFAER